MHAHPLSVDEALERARCTDRVVDPVLAAESLAVGGSPLTARGTEVLVTARKGGSVTDIARELHLSEGAVRNHLSSVIGKTGARNRSDAASIAAEQGWLLLWRTAAPCATETVGATETARRPGSPGLS